MPDSNRYPDIALEVPRILLPAGQIPLETWAVIACDQHTSDVDYWQTVAGTVGTAPSTLELVFPEVFLEAPDKAERLRQIRSRMADYGSGNVLQELSAGFVLVDRQTPHVPSRRGLLVALDLEQYSFDAGAETLIRTTEGTVVSRLAPRIEVRRGAPLEIPHIMVLIDDPARTVIEPLFEQQLPSLYDLDLMLGGGRVRGWQVGTDDLVAQVVTALRGLLPSGEAAPMLYAMGDGNHSFATAQAVWQQIKNDAGGLAAVTDHPARHAMVELVNLHDDGLVFEPIHRVLFGCDLEELLALLQDRCPAHAAQATAYGDQVTVQTFESVEDWEQARAVASTATQHRLPFVAGDHFGIILLQDPTRRLSIVSLQEALSELEQRRPDVVVDYIHGDDEVRRLGSKPGNVGIFSEVIDKHALFPTIRAEGPLPRKSFSLGEAEEKRYYLECRRITADSDR